MALQTILRDRLERGQLRRGEAIVLQQSSRADVDRSRNPPQCDQNLIFQRQNSAHVESNMSDPGGGKPIENKWFL